jgi:hypothetical protein
VVPIAAVSFVAIVANHHFRDQVSEDLCEETRSGVNGLKLWSCGV